MSYRKKQTLKLCALGLAIFGGLVGTTVASAVTCGDATTTGTVCTDATTVNVTVGVSLTASFSHASGTSTPAGTADDPLTVTAAGLKSELNEAATTTATISTNDLTGYTLSVADDNDDTSLRRDTSNYIATNANIAGDSDNTGWAVKVSTCPAAYTTCKTSYNAMVPSTSSLVLAQVGTVNSVISEDKTVITYGVRPSSNQAAGTYTDTIVYTVTTNAN